MTKNVNNINSCCICFSADETLYKIIDEDATNTKIIDKLKYCVPEVFLQETNLICIKCITLLNSLYAFKKSIIESCILKNCKETSNEISDDDVLNTTPDSVTTALENLQLRQSTDLKSLKFLTECNNAPTRYDSSMWKYECPKCKEKFLFGWHLKLHINRNHNSAQRKQDVYQDRWIKNKISVTSFITTIQLPMKKVKSNKGSSKQSLISNAQNAIMGKKRKSSAQIIKEDSIKGKKRKTQTVNQKVLKSKKNEEEFCNSNHNNKLDALRKVLKDNAKILKTFYLAKNMELHKERYTCVLCGKTFITPRDLIKHKELHEEKHRKNTTDTKSLTENDGFDFIKDCQLLNYKKTLKNCFDFKDILT